MTTQTFVQPSSDDLDTIMEIVREMHPLWIDMEEPQETIGMTIGDKATSTYERTLMTVGTCATPKQDDLHAIEAMERATHPMCATWFIDERRFWNNRLPHRWGSSSHRISKQMWLPIDGDYDDALHFVVWISPKVDMSSSKRMELKKGQGHFDTPALIYLKCTTAVDRDLYIRIQVGMKTVTQHHNFIKKVVLDFETYWHLELLRTTYGDRAGFALQFWLRSDDSRAGNSDHTHWPWEGTSKRSGLSGDALCSNLNSVGIARHTSS